MATSGIGRRRDLARKEANPAYTEKRAQMVNAAAMLFKDKGYEATTLSDVAEAVGTDRASMYYYVASKEELLQEAVGDVSGGNLQIVKALRESDLSAVERIRQFIEHTLRSYDDNYPQIFVYIQEDMTKVARQQDSWARGMVAQMHEFEGSVLALLRDGVADGSFRDDLDIEVVAKALWGMLNWTHRWHKPGGARSAEVIARTFSGVFLDGLSASPPR